MKRDEGAESLREETRWKVENEKVKHAGGKLEGTGAGEANGDCNCGKDERAML